MKPLVVSSMLSEKGVLLVDEWYYESYVVPFITSSIVFYSLKLINLLNIDMGKIGERIYTRGS
jgi:hypothetical protein